MLSRSCGTQYAAMTTYRHDATGIAEKRGHSMSEIPNKQCALSQDVRTLLNTADVQHKRITELEHENKVLDKIVSSVAYNMQCDECPCRKHCSDGRPGGCKAEFIARAHEEIADERPKK